MEQQRLILWQKRTVFLAGLPLFWMIFALTPCAVEHGLGWDTFRAEHVVEPKICEAKTCRMEIWDRVAIYGILCVENTTFCTGDMLLLTLMEPVTLQNETSAKLCDMVSPNCCQAEKALYRVCPTSICPYLGYLFWCSVFLLVIIMGVFMNTCLFHYIRRLCPGLDNTPRHRVR